MSYNYSVDHFFKKLTGWGRVPPLVSNAHYSTRINKLMSTKYQNICTQKLYG